MESIRNSMDLKVKENIRIPRKKGEPEQPVIVSKNHKITSLI
jgi:hypothetical protein